MPVNYGACSSCSRCGSEHDLIVETDKMGLPVLAKCRACSDELVLLRDIKRLQRILDFVRNAIERERSERVPKKGERSERVPKKRKPAY